MNCTIKLKRHSLDLTSPKKLDKAHFSQQEERKKEVNKHLGLTQQRKTNKFIQ